MKKGEFASVSSDIVAFDSREVDDHGFHHGIESSRYHDRHRGRAKYRAWGHEHVTTSLLENAVILETIKKKRGASIGGHPHLPSFTATRHVCLGGALARPCTISVTKLNTN